MRIDHKIAKAFSPIARTAANTLYNGVAVGSGPAGIPIGDATVALVQFTLGAISATIGSVTYTACVSAKSTTTSAADIVDVDEAVAVIVAGDANSVVEGALRIANIDAGAQSTGEPLYLYIKRVQGTTESIVDAVNVVLTETKVADTDQAFEFNV